MNATTNFYTTPCEHSKDALHLQRSKLIDAFAEIEMAVVIILDGAGVAQRGEPLKQRLSSVLTIKPSPTYSKARKSAVDDVIRRIDTLLALRNDVVHARLSVAVFENEIHALFVNARETNVVGRTARVITLAEMQILTKQVRELVRSLEASLINPPSSPPPPSPGEAGDP